MGGGYHRFNPPNREFAAARWIKWQRLARLAVMSPDWGKRSASVSARIAGAIQDFESTGIDAATSCRLAAWLKLAFENVLAACEGRNLDYSEQRVGRF